MATKEITYNGEVLGRYIPSDSWAEGLGFYSNDDEFIQVGSWKYNSGKVLLQHIHNRVERTITHTQEVIYVRKGRLKARIYSPDEQLVEEIEMRDGDTLILLQGGHGYDILDDNTEVLEIKNGPYLGADVDRRRF